MAEKGAKVLLLGDSGSGKTFSTGTLADCGLAKVCFLWMEPGAFHSVAQYFSKANRPIPDNFHWMTAPLATQSWDDMIGMSKIVNTMSQKGIANYTDPKRNKHDAFIRVLTCLKSFRCERTGKDLGEVDSWGTDTVLVFESLSALSNSAMALLIGSRPLADMGEWQMAMNQIEYFVNKFTDLQCHAVMTSHLDREADEQLGGTKLMPGTLGKKLAPKIPRYFDEVIHSKREGSKFSWSTDTTDMTVKTRLLPIENGQPASFAPLLASWRRLAGLGQPTTQPGAAVVVPLATQKQTST